ncbi:helix-turn-helix transcriptional regulator [Actinokineospora enzanensis]|uniref:helix-turn-helix transcriptional regulator n=1 Tax=Actinokineospora enzanensis TaxID=155975 RepID=UPI00047649E6|nr:LuxR family transcriptional regulator [Actinokineospora enzanensis]
MSGLLGRRVECGILDGLPARARAGAGQVLVLRGEAGIGKTALLDHLAAAADGCRVVRAAGVESERELVYSGLHQLCAPFLAHVDRLPDPQRDALGTAFGLSAGGRVNRFLVGLGVLTLLAEVAETEPLVCLVDDAQWLDRMSAQVLAFVARRLLAERVVLVFATRESAAELADLPELVVEGLGQADARALLDSLVTGPVDPRVRDRVLAEAHGNPLALVELPRSWTGLTAPGPLTGRLEQGYADQVADLPPDTRRLLLAAAAEPLGDATLLWAAAGLLGLGADPATAAEQTGLIEFGPRVRFRHPLVRSAVYRSATARDRQAVHRALAEVTDPRLDPDRRAWHRALATVTPDGDVAADLEGSAVRARARGGLVAAASFLEQAALLTPEPDRRADRELAAARARRAAGLLDAALDLLTVVESGPPDPLRTAEVAHLRGQIAFDRRHGTDAARLLLHAARCLAPRDTALAREAHLEALSAAIWADGPGGSTAVVEAAEAACAASRVDGPPRAVDLVLDAFAVRFTKGYAAANELLGRALEALHDLPDPDDAAETGRVLWLLGNRAGGIVAAELGDFAAAHALAERQVQLARDAGALVQLQFALNFLAATEMFTGDLSGAETSLAEDSRIADVTRNPPVGYSGVLLAAFRGHETEAIEMITATAREAAARGQGRLVTFADYATAVLYNGLGRHDAARDAAARVFERDWIGYGMLATMELAEAASRTGDGVSLAAAIARSAERARVTPTDWVLGVDARLRALAGDEQCYRRSLDHLSRTPNRVDTARGHLLFGEWLRREGRRVEAREHLRAAHDRLTTMGLTAFADRARRELLATGETVRKRSEPEAADELTAQEFQIARLAREGLSNPEIGTRLFISPRTVEWHLRKVFTKLGISSRRQLRDVAR